MSQPGLLLSQQYRRGVGWDIRVPTCYFSYFFTK